MLARGSTARKCWNWDLIQVYRLLAPSNAASIFVQSALPPYAWAGFSLNLQGPLSSHLLCSQCPHTTVQKPPSSVHTALGKMGC